MCVVQCPWDVGFWVWGFRVEGLGSRFRVLESRVQGWACQGSRGWGLGLSGFAFCLGLGVAGSLMSLAESRTFPINMIFWKFQARSPISTKPRTQRTPNPYF